MPILFHTIIFMMRWCYGVGQSSIWGRDFASSLKFHSIHRSISFVYPFPVIKVRQCSRIPISIFCKIVWRLNSRVGWNIWRSFVVFLLLMKLVDIDMFFSILFSDKFSNGFTSQRKGTGDICGFVSQTVWRSLSDIRPFARNIHHEFVPPPKVCK